MRSILLRSAALSLLGTAALGQDAQNVVLYDGVGTNVTFGANNTRKVLLEDFDGDGDLDMFTFNFEQPPQIFVNDGTGNYTLDADGNNNNQLDNLAAAPIKGAQFFDYNNDGRPDLALALGRGTVGNPQRNFVFVNATTVNNDPRFVQDGFVDVANPFDHSYDVAMLDGNGGTLTGNGTDAVLVVANRIVEGSPLPDNGRNLLYRGTGGAGSFAVADDQSSDIFTDGPFSSRDIAVGNLDNDPGGREDIFICNAGNGDQPNAVYLSLGGNFNNSNDESITNNPGNSYGAALGDLDADGDLDIVVGNRASATTGEANFLIENESTPGNWNGTFITGSPITDDVEPTYDVAIGDLDGDGDLDVVAANNASQNAIYMNNLADDATVTSGNWFGFAVGFSTTRLSHGAILAQRGRTRSVTIGEVSDYSGDPAHQGDEVALANANLGGGEANFFYRSFGQMFADLGSGSTTGATTPRLSGDGFVSPSSDAAMFMDGVDPNASFAMFVTLVPSAVAFNGGTSFVDGQSALLLTVSTADGGGNVDVDIPAGSVPTALEGTPIVVQAFSDDPVDGGLGAMTNGLSVVLQN